MNPIEAPIAQGRQLLDAEFVVEARRVPIAVVEVHLQPESRDGQEEDRSEGDADDALNPGAMADRLEEEDAEKRRRHRADGEPGHERPAHRSSSGMNRRTHRLHHQRGDEIARHCRDRLDVEEKNEHRSHERATAHPGEPHSATDNQSCQRDVQINMHRSPLLGPRLRVSFDALAQP